MKAPLPLSAAGRLSRGMPRRRTPPRPPDDLPTPRQREVLRAVYGHLLAEGVPPTVLWLVRRFGYRSTNSIVVHLKALRGKGYLDWLPETSRGLRLSGVAVRVEITDDAAGARLRRALGEGTP